MKKIEPKKIWQLLLFLFFLVCTVHLLSLLTLDRILQYKHVNFISDKLARELDGYKIALISDTHENVSCQQMEAIVEKLNELDIDLLLLGGDFSYDRSKVNQALEILSFTKTRDGIYGVAGNHDISGDLFSLMQEYGITSLSDNGFSLRPGLYLAGLSDLYNGQPDIAKATQGAATEDFVLLLTHNPDVLMLQDTHGIDLALAGHLHGGQITFFGIFAPALFPDWVTSYDQRFMSGWAKSKDATPVYVSNGVGSYNNIPRLFARPQIIIVTLKCE